MPAGTAQLNAVMYFDGIQQDATGFQSVDGGIVQGAFFRRGAREQNEAMRSICSFVEVGQSHVLLLNKCRMSERSISDEGHERVQGTPSTNLRTRRSLNSLMSFVGENSC